MANIKIQNLVTSQKGVLLPGTKLSLKQLSDEEMMFVVGGGGWWHWDDYWERWTDSFTYEA